VLQRVAACRSVSQRVTVVRPFMHEKQLDEAWHRRLYGLSQEAARSISLSPKFPEALFYKLPLEASGCFVYYQSKGVGDYSALGQLNKELNRPSVSSWLPILLFMRLRDHVKYSKFLLYTDYYRKGTASKDREDRKDNISDNGENNSKENEEKEVTVEKQHKKGG